MRRVCVSIAPETVEAGVAAAEKISPLADVIEIRLDYLRECAVAPFLVQLSKPLLFTNRPTWEGGRFTDDEQARIAPLLEAVRLGAHYVMWSSRPLTPRIKRCWRRSIIPPRS